MPSIATRLVRAVSPPTIRTAPRATPSSSARRRTIASFAAPSTGGAATRTRNTPSSPTPSIASRPPRGVSRTTSVHRHGAQGCGWSCERSPKIARPTRMSVAPSSTATSKSSVMPIERPAPSSGHSRRRRARQLGQPPERRPRVLRSIDQPPDGHQTSKLEPGQPRQRRQAPRPSSSARKPSLAGSASTLTCR